ncbi:MORN repeat-containing protein 3-like isoform X2 [Sitophilus oryzae]|uniref:MORN repeat-containing protein 3 n=1 Tax=Sitophilus oryzae TaxID=7048 RepID=A0A6J2Y2E0_SITOR|nr:MORN repeat-containing protein 3-like isoform X2 [Sitophilus oryzae]
MMGFLDIFSTVTSLLCFFDVLSFYTLNVLTSLLIIQNTMPFLKERNILTRSRVLEDMTKKNGFRRTIYNTVGDRYIGEWKDDKKSGKGIILTRNDDLYEGDMERNFRHGFGVLSKKIPNTEVYQLCYRGDWKNGKMHGTGLRIYPDNSFYLGQFCNGKRHWHGQQWFPDGAFFDGYFENDKRNGVGVFVQANGNRYEGEWRDDLKHGNGLFFHLDNGQLQDGVWVDDWCVHSVLRDINYRQCSIAPTIYPVPQIFMKDAETICTLTRERILLGLKETCEPLETSMSSFMYHIVNDSDKVYDLGGVSLYS